MNLFNEMELAITPWMNNQECNNFRLAYEQFEPFLTNTKMILLWRNFRYFKILQ